MPSGPKGPRHRLERAKARLGDGWVYLKTISRDHIRWRSKLPDAPPEGHGSTGKPVDRTDSQISSLKRLSIAHAKAASPSEAEYIERLLAIGAPFGPQGTFREQASDAWDRAREQAGRSGTWLNEKGRDAVRLKAEWTNALLATSAAQQIDLWLGAAFAGPATAFDQAMDAVFNATGAGGHWHRLIDGGHDLAGAWQAIAQSCPDNGMLQNAAGYVTAVWKDAVTPCGIPIQTLSPEQLQLAHHFGDFFGLSHGWVNDMLSVTATELLGTVTGAVAIVLNLDPQNKTKLAGLTGSLGFAALAGANPVLAIISVIALARTLKGLEPHDAAHVALGSAASASVILVSSVFVGHVWVGLVLGIVCAIVIRQLALRALEPLKEMGWQDLVSVWQQMVPALAERIKGYRVGLRPA